MQIQFFLTILAVGKKVNYLKVMEIPQLISINRIKRRYHTGEEPVWVECNDLNSYICKYMRSSSAAYKLTCELIGDLLIHLWGIYTPEIAFVKIKSQDWPHFTSINFSAPSLGSRFIPESIDITPVSYSEIKRSEALTCQLMMIGLFDLWVGNEDRNYNNANLLYDLVKNELIAIDHGCIFNTASFDYKMSLLTFNESILQSDLASYLFAGLSGDKIQMLIKKMKVNYEKCIDLCRARSQTIISIIPREWNVPISNIHHKLDELFDSEWIERCWLTFVELMEDRE